MKLFLVHCGFYDPELCGGQYEFHVNFFVAAADEAEAKVRAKARPEFQAKRMHVDGLEEIEAVDGYRLNLSADSALEGRTLVRGYQHRELAPKKSNT